MLQTDRPEDTNAVEDCRQQSRLFLAKSREYLAEGDLHQASEKGWGAAAWMAKAVAHANGWEYRTHSQFNVVLNTARDLTGNDDLRRLRDGANGLHQRFYERKQFLDADDIARSLDDMATLLNILQPLTEQ